MVAIGKCKLCLREGLELQESHFLPKAAYKAVQELAGVPPLTIRAGLTLQKNDQIKAHLLCAECEDRFNKNGEAWVLNYCNRVGRGFRLYDLLQTLQPEIDQPGLKMYAAASIFEIDASKLVYFLLSILWRASVHNWHWGKDALDTDTLGEKYEEQFRRYLLGLTDLPTNVAVQIFLFANPSNWEGFTIPFLERLHDGMWRHTFNFLGISFRALIANPLDEETRSACIYRSPKKYIFVGDNIDKVLMRDFADVIRKSNTVGKIRR